MREAVIVSTARTPIGKAYRGAFNDTSSPSMAAPVVKEVVARANLDPAEIDDVIVGSALQQGTQGFNVGRQIATAAGLPVSVSGQSVDRQCSSGLMAVSMAAKQIMVDGMEVVLAGGIESISLVQNKNQNVFRARDPNVLEATPDMYMPMIGTAEVVSKRYNISREAQDEYSLLSQRRTAAAQDAGLFGDEIIPSHVTKVVVNRETGETSHQQVTLDQDECNRPSTNAEGLAALKPVMGEDGFITAGNASQLSDGFAACALMEASAAEKRGLEPLGYYRGMAVAGCEPDEMGIGPIYRRTEAPRAHRPHHGRHRSLGAERGVRLPGRLLPRPARHPQRDPQRERRRHLHRTPLRHERCAHGRPRSHRGEAPRRPLRRHHHVRGRWDGRCRSLRGRLTMGQWLVGDILERSVLLYGDRPAVIDGDVRRTYAETAERIRSLAAGILALGVEPGQHIGILASNSHRYFETYFAAHYAGTPLAPLNMRLSGPELEFIINDGELRALLVGPEFLELLESFRDRLPSLEHVIVLADSAPTGCTRTKRWSPGTRPCPQPPATGARTT